MIDGRKKFNGLTEEEIEHIVETVTQRVINNFYTSVGRSVVEKVFWIVGIAAVVVAGYLGLTGKFKP
jgi:hypothetical protein